MPLFKGCGLSLAFGDGLPGTIAILAQCRKPLYTGSSTIVAWAGMLGATGAILAVANLEPERCVDAFAGDVQAQKDLLGAHKILSCYGVKGIKEELARRHGTSTVCRLG